MKTSEVKQAQSGQCGSDLLCSPLCPFCEGMYGGRREGEDDTELSGGRERGGPKSEA